MRNSAHVVIPFGTPWNSPGNITHRIHLLLNVPYRFMTSHCCVPCSHNLLGSSLLCSNGTSCAQQWIVLNTLVRRLTTDVRSDWQVVSRSGRMSDIYLLTVFFNLYHFFYRRCLIFFVVVSAAGRKSTTKCIYSVPYAITYLISWYATGDSLSGWRSGNALNSYQGNARFEHRLAWMRFFLVFIRLFRNFEIVSLVGHDHLLPTPSQFVIHLGIVK
jgi:hypothetical protein